jgi:hypothetical protein
LRTNWGSVPNKEQKQFVVNVVFHAKEIPNNYVTFPKNDGGYAIVISLTHEHLNYKVI